MPHEADLDGIEQGTKMSANQKKGQPLHWDIQGTTNFYPLYGEGRDVVEPVLPVHRTNFQEIVPRYRLSSTETRDQGVGPVFDEVAYRPSTNFHRASNSPQKRQTRSKKPEKRKRKIRIDFLL
ncbi:hypothetical protein WDW89_09450 [Deltaproteobacteria bacterium TL4]